MSSTWRVLDTKHRACTHRRHRSVCSICYTAFVRTIQFIALWALVVSAAACGSSPSSPSASAGTNTSSRPTTTGRVVDAVTGAAISGVTPNGSEAGRATTSTASDASGAFTVSADTASSTGLAFSFAASGYLTRSTFVKVPGNAGTVTLIPSSFDLPAFDQLARSTPSLPVLMRWAAAPALVVQTQAMTFTGINDTQFTTINDTMTDGEYVSQVADLNFGLPLMTGGQFSGFSGTTRVANAAGASVTMLVTGQITIGRFVGLTTATGSVGYSRWQFRSDGTVTGGMIMMDRDFERSLATTLRAVRVHELGHALGYNHITTRESAMNPLAHIDPNALDQAATRLVFMRPPGSRTPDIDPSGFSINRVGDMKLTWSDPIR